LVNYSIDNQTTYYYLNITILPTGSGAVNLTPSGSVYVAGTTVTLKAVANSGVL
jgi:hypothetical protein